MRSRNRSPLLRVSIVVSALLVVGTVHAGELVRFVDGRYLEVRGHSLHGQAVRLEVAPGAVVAFAADRIEWIERAGLRVLDASNADRDARPTSRSSEPSAVERRESHRAAVRTRTTERRVEKDFARAAVRGPQPIR